MLWVTSDANLLSIHTRWHYFRTVWCFLCTNHSGCRLPEVIIVFHSNISNIHTWWCGWDGRITLDLEEWLQNISQTRWPGLPRYQEVALLNTLMFDNTWWKVISQADLSKSRLKKMDRIIPSACHTLLLLISGISFTKQSILIPRINNLCVFVMSTVHPSTRLAECPYPFSVSSDDSNQGLYLISGKKSQTVRSGVKMISTLWNWKKKFGSAGVDMS